MAVVGVLVMINGILLTAQAMVLDATAEGATAPIEAVIEMRGDSYVIEAGPIRGPRDEVMPDLVTMCAVDPPPFLHLTFAPGTLFEDARAVRTDLRREPQLVCPVAY